MQSIFIQNSLKNNFKISKHGKSTSNIQQENLTNFSLYMNNYNYQQSSENMNMSIYVMHKHLWQINMIYNF